MARYPFTWSSKLRIRNKNQIYIIISALLVVVLVVVFIYGPRPSDKSQEQPVETLPEPEKVTTYADKRPKVPIVETLSEPQKVTTEEKVDVQPVPTLAAETKPQLDLISVPPKPRADADPKVAKIIAEAMELVNAKPSRIIQARERLNDALLICQDRRQQAFVKEQLSKLAEQWLFSKSLFPDDKLCSSYKVKPGDQLRVIGQRYKVPYQILMQINNIRSPQELQAGQTIKVINGPFNVKVYLATFTMDLYLQNTFVRSFPVGLGKPGMETPTGLWRVKPGGKLVKPVWTNPLTGRTYRPEDQDYPLGSRWIGLEGLEGLAKGREGFAIHGTKDPEQIGTADSQGCIRLHNGDAILIYNMLVPIHSLVMVEE